MSSQIVPIREKNATVKSMIVEYKDQMETALQGQVKIDVFLNAIFSCVQKTPALLDCTPRSLMNAVVELSQLGLLPGVLGQAFLVPFRNNKTGKTEVQLIIGYKGLLKLCRNSGEIATVSSNVVYSNEAFVCHHGTEPKLAHEPVLELGADRGKFKAVYAIARLKNGETQFEVMTKADIEKIRARSKAKDGGPWQSDYEEMARKSVLRRLCKTLPASEKLHEAVALDELASAGVAQELNVIDLPEDDAPALPPGPPDGGKPPSRLDQVVTDRKAKPKPKEASLPIGGDYAEGSDPDPFFDREPGEEG